MKILNRRSSTSLSTPWTTSSISCARMISKELLCQQFHIASAQTQPMLTLEFLEESRIKLGSRTKTSSFLQLTICLNMMKLKMLSIFGATLTCMISTLKLQRKVFTTCLQFHAQKVCLFCHSWHHVRSSQYLSCYQVFRR